MDAVTGYLKSLAEDYFYPEALLDELWDIQFIVGISDDGERLSLAFLQEGYENGIKESRLIFLKWTNNWELFEDLSKTEYESVTEVGEIIYD